MPAACFWPAVCFQKRGLITAFALVATLDFVVLIVRIVSMFADSSVPENLPLVRAEVLLLALAVAGLLIEFGRRRLPNASSMPTGQGNKSIEKQ